MDDAKGRDGGPSTTHDFIAGWLGGLAGILLSNPLEVLKVRLQVARNNHHTTSTSSKTSSTGRSGSVVTPGTKTSLSFLSLYRKEGWRILVAGTAGPIVGLALLDSAFFAGYGVAMNYFAQDRQDPCHLGKVFLSGASSGGVCALLQTPVEVVKCTAQAESSSKPRSSYQIAKSIYRTKGLRGFYVGGLVTAAEDGIGSGIFFATYFWIRRRFRSRDHDNQHHQDDRHHPTTDKRTELGRILLAGGFAGVLGAVVPYPLDIIKTRLQTRVIASPSASAAVLTSPFESPPTGKAGSAKPSVWSIAKEIYSDSVNDHRTVAGSRWRTRFEGMKGFSRGIQATSISGFVGSSATITMFEGALMALESMDNDKSMNASKD